MPKVSIILPTYNGANEIARSINSVLCQTYTDFELIVIDDGSTDNTQEILFQFKENNKIKLFWQENKGTSEARNLGLEKADREYIAFQDSDDIWREDKLEKQISIITSDPDCGIVYSDMKRVLQNGKEFYLEVPIISNNNVINPKTSDYQVIGIGMQTVLVRKKIVDCVGGFDPQLPRFIDLDWFIRISKVTKFLKIKEPLVKYFQMPGISSDPGKAAVARILLLNKYKDEIYCKNSYVSLQWAKIALVYWRAGDMPNAYDFAKRSFIMNPYSIKQDLKLLVVFLFPPKIKKIIPSFIINRYW